MPRAAIAMGVPWLGKDLKDDGEAISEKRVRRLMCEEQIQGRVPKRFKHTTDSDHTDPIAANVLDRDFTAAAQHESPWRPLRQCGDRELLRDREERGGRAVSHDPMAAEPPVDSLRRRTTISQSRG